MLLVGLGTVVLWKRGLCNKKAEYTPGRRINIEDIEVVSRSRSQPDDESVLGRLHRIGNELEAANKPDYHVQLLSMKSLNAEPGSTSKRSSFSESTLQEYESPNEI